MVMDRVMIAAEGSPRELIERYSPPEVLELRFDPAEHQQAAEKLAELAPQRAAEMGSSPPALGQRRSRVHPPGGWRGPRARACRTRRTENPPLPPAPASGSSPSPPRCAAPRLTTRS